MILFDMFLSFLIPLPLLLPPPTLPTYLHTQKERERGGGGAVSSVTSEAKEASRRKPVVTSSSTWKVCLNLNMEKLRKLFLEAGEGILFLSAASAPPSIREPITHERPDVKTYLSSLRTATKDRAHLPPPPLLHSSTPQLWEDEFIFSIFTVDETEY